MMKRLCLAMLSAAVLSAGCTGDDSARAGSANPDASEVDGGEADVRDDASRPGDDAAGDASDAPPWTPGDQLGGDRPAEVLLPDDYTADRPWPLVILLHGYTASASLQDAYFKLSRHRHNRGFIIVLPDGTRDSAGNRFWNATDACCDFRNTGVDDVAYLEGLIDEAIERLAVDSQRVYLVGHSNGGFMSYRLACEIGSKLTAIASLAGASYDDPDDCAEDGQAAILQIHGDMDGTVLYDGGHFNGRAYPGAREVVERWAARNQCDSQPQDGDAINLDSAIAGDETRVERWQGCDASTSVELWTIEGGSHTPALSSDFSDHVLDFLFAHEAESVR